MRDIYLVLGGNGFIGFSVIQELVKLGKKVRTIDYSIPDELFKFKEVDYCIGDIREKSFLARCMKDVCIVLDFISTTMPNSNDISVVNEIDNTLRYHDYILSIMTLCGVDKYIFPSSGGAIYGNKESGYATEKDILSPSTPYGVGKQMTENIIKYYHQKCGIKSSIFRIGNVYGSARFRKKAQGAVDVFIQNALLGEKIVLWGNSRQSIRDYIFLEDVAKAIVMTINKGIDGIEVYNIGTGVGTSLIDLIEIIQDELGTALEVEHREEMASGINRIVLSVEKMHEHIGWRASVSIRDGIKKTILIKKKLLKIE